MRKLYTRSQSQACGLVDMEPFAVLRQKSAARGSQEKCFETVLKYDKIGLSSSRTIGKLRQASLPLASFPFERLSHSNWRPQAARSRCGISSKRF
jgi:hypothetical protein